MKLKIYEKEGWVNWKGILALKIPCMLTYGPRGAGKTYGILKHIIMDTNDSFVFMRRTQKQLNTISVEGLSPFIKLRNDFDLDMEIKFSSKTETASIIINGEVRGIGVALSTFANLRGFDSSAKWLIYDEFIPSPSERNTIKMEGFEFMNVIETINRNRELFGDDPLNLVGCGNSNEIGNAVFLELGLVTIAERMKEKEQEVYINRNRGVIMIDCFKSPIAEKKKETFLYKLADKNSSFYKMAIGNEFVDDSIAIIRSRNLKEYSPIVTISDITFYEHKSESKFYVSEHRAGSPPIYSTASADLEKFQKEFYYLWNAYLDREIEFENKLCAVVFDKLF